MFSLQNDAGLKHVASVPSSCVKRVETTIEGTTVELYCSHKQGTEIKEIDLLKFALPSPFDLHLYKSPIYFKCNERITVENFKTLIQILDSKSSTKVCEKHVKINKLLNINSNNNEEPELIDSDIEYEEEMYDEYEENSSEEEDHEQVQMEDADFVSDDGSQFDD